MSNPFIAAEQGEYGLEEPRGKSNSNNPWNNSSTFTSTPAKASHTKSATVDMKSQREINLELREAALRVKEAQLAERENRLGDLQSPNWPRCKPMLYHDIEKDIPAEGKPLVKSFYFAWYVSCAAYIMNMLAALSLLVTKADGSATCFGVSLLIMLVGIPVSFSFWYRNLYFGVKKDSSASFFFFFVNYSFHLGATIILCIGIAGWGGAGIIYMMDRYTKNETGSGIMCTITSILFIFEVVYGLFLLKSAIRHYRSKGMSSEKAKKEAAVGFAKSRVGQEVAIQSLKSASTR